MLNPTLALVSPMLNPEPDFTHHKTCRSFLHTPLCPKDREDAMLLPLQQELACTLPLGLQHDSPSLQVRMQAGPGLNGEGKVSVLQLPFSLIPVFDCL